MGWCARKIHKVGGSSLERGGGGIFFYNAENSRIIYTAIIRMHHFSFDI